MVINNRALPHKCLSASVDAAWPGLLLTQPFPTAMAALLANMRRGYNTVLVRKGAPTDTPPNVHGLQQYHCFVAVYTFQQSNEINEGSTDLGLLQPLNVRAKASLISFAMWN